MKYPPVFSQKKSKNLLRNRSARRLDPTVRKIRGGEVTSRWTDPEPATKEEQIAEIAQALESGESLLVEAAPVETVHGEGLAE